MTSRAFQNYLEVGRQGPPALWWALRLVAFAFTLFVLVMIPLSGEHGLAGVERPRCSRPVVFAFAPGLWRQVCPMAFLNQLPRTFGLSRGRRLPAGMSRVAYLVSVCAFFGLISLRPLVFNTSAGWTLTLLAVPLGLAALGGFVFAGRSGWCGTFCPLAPIQRAYGLAPVVRVRNGYCETCLGCQKNCYDFNPRATLLADFDDRDPWYVLQKRFFIGALPGFILGFFGYSVLGEVLGEALGLGNRVAVYYLVLAGGMTSSLGLFTVLETFLRIPQVHLSAIFAQIALVIFYGVLSQPFMDTLGLYIAPLQTMAWLDEVMVVVVALVAATVLIRHFIAHRAYHQDEAPTAAPKLKVALDRLGDDSAGLPQLEERASGNRLPAAPSQTIPKRSKTLGSRLTSAVVWVCAGPIRLRLSRARKTLKSQARTNWRPCDASGWKAGHDWPVPAGSNRVGWPSIWISIPTACPRRHPPPPPQTWLRPPGLAAWLSSAMAQRGRQPRPNCAA